VSVHGCCDGRRHPPSSKPDRLAHACERAGSNGSYNGLPVVLIQNYDYILDVDVFHDSHSAGTLIDAWPPNITDDSSPSAQQQPFNQWMYQVTP
jgi:hypothetical protein